jgi:formylglycine-generating enzyme
METALRFVLSLLALSPCAWAAETEMALVPAGNYRPLFRGPKDAKETPVNAFLLDTIAVTNGEFLAFVRAHPIWRRSQVKRLFADEGYLAHWEGDLDLGAADAAQPVTRVSWFAAKAFAAAAGDCPLRRSGNTRRAVVLL